MKTNKIKIDGKVQGVYFRASAKQKAMNLGVNGYVKNESDGTVTVEVEGEDEAVSEMINWCKKGPALARVQHVHIETQAAQNFVSFDIRE